MRPASALLHQLARSSFQFGVAARTVPTRMTMQQTIWSTEGTVPMRRSAKITAQAE